MPIAQPSAGRSSTTAQPVADVRLLGGCPTPRCFSNRVAAPLSHGPQQCAQSPARLPGSLWDAATAGSAHQLRRTRARRRDHSRSDDHHLGHYAGGGAGGPSTTSQTQSPSRTHVSGFTDKPSTMGLQVAPIPVDDDGLDVAKLLAHKVGAVLVAPAHSYPTGTVLSAERRRARQVGGRQRRADHRRRLRRRIPL